jgi:hypothetical protein
MSLAAKRILREIGDANQKLEREFPRLSSILHDIQVVEAITQHDHIVLPKRVTRIGEYREMVERKMEMLSEEFTRAKAFVAEVKARTPSTTNEMLEDLRVLAVIQRYEAIKSKIDLLLEEISEAIQRVSPKVELVERRFKEKVSLSIISPRKGEVVHRGTTYTIRWTWVGPARDSVLISLLVRGTYLRDITLGKVPNIGACECFIPAETPPSDDYQIAVRPVVLAAYPGSLAFNDNSGVGFGYGDGTVVSYPDANVSAVSDTFRVR